MNFHYFFYISLSGTSNANRNNRLLNHLKRGDELESTWDPVITEERQYKHLIKLVIDANVENSNIDFSARGPKSAALQMDLKSDVYVDQAYNQAAHAYHVLFRGNKDHAMVVNSPNASINDRTGVVIRYYPTKNNGSGQFLVRLGTKRDGPATRFSGEKCYVSPRYLSATTQKEPPANRLKTHFSIVIVSIIDRDPVIHTSFTITRDFLSMLENSLPKPELWQDQVSISHVRPFVLSTKRESMLRRALLNGPRLQHQFSSAKRWNWFMQNDQLVFTTRQSKQHIQCAIQASESKETSSAQPVQGVDSESVSNSRHEADTDVSCSCCNDTESDAEGQVESPDPSAFPVPACLEEHLSEPDRIRFSFPFHTSESIIPSASTHLNELDMTQHQQKLLIEEELMHGLTRYPISISNKDAFSLYPHKNASAAVVDLWTSW